MANFSAAFGQQLLWLRLHAGLAQSELAVQIGVDASVISRLESGTTRCSVEVFTKISFALNVKPGEVLDAFLCSAPDEYKELNGDT
ncbi:helix-turn-helix domain-containing protein [Brachybacterium alimentarium]|uniref:helix-turn-helix domain-containing protein n=1 Tax=Brachybacterium alimentarium TaxID=47845 RepID=UPI000DF3B433|nr:XRE family transcriptional regulator [Brachybacterium sp. JB7]RCS81559.1 XRE family transcriptional regulator [Brachybacterium alimentarium]RCS83431.1 XRE family transcriptional regulator [Brachybacterium alimentarium]